MSAYNGLPLEDLRHIQHLGSQAMGHDERQAIDSADGHRLPNLVTRCEVAKTRPLSASGEHLDRLTSLIALSETPQRRKSDFQPNAE
jgi:hypothetical protein